MRSLPARLLIVSLCVACAGLTACETTDNGKKKKRPPLPGEEMSDLSWGRPTGPNDISSPLGLPMSR